MMDRQQNDILMDDEPQDDRPTLPNFIRWLKNGVIKVPRAEDRGDADGPGFTH